MWPTPEYEMDFARPIFAWQRVRWPGLVMVLVLLSLVLWCYREAAEQAAYVQTLTQRQQQLTEQHAAMQGAPSQTAPRPLEQVAAKPVAALSQPQQKAAQKIVQQLNVRWFDLLQALEASQVADIALLQLTPDANRGQFVLSGEAKSYAALLNYVSQLQGLPALHEVHLQKHQVNDSHPQRPVSFEIQGGWQP
ncbi:MAG TPA: PilN domain-containing protein [Methylophilus sp.]